MNHIVEGALIAARDYLRGQENDRTAYGFYPGGDPRDFSPDEESCTAEELAAHKAACESWERGNRPEYPAHYHSAENVGGKVVMTSHAGSFGIGVYTMRDEDADDVLEQIDAALASLQSSEGEPR